MCKVFKGGGVKPRAAPQVAYAVNMGQPKAGICRDRATAGLQSRHRCVAGHGRV